MSLDLKENIHKLWWIHLLQMDDKPVKHVSSLLLFSSYSELLMLVQRDNISRFIYVHLYTKITNIHPDLLIYITIYLEWNLY